MLSNCLIKISIQVNALRLEKGRTEKGKFKRTYPRPWQQRWWSSRSCRSRDHFTKVPYPGIREAGIVLDAVTPDFLSPCPGVIPLSVINTRSIWWLWRPIWWPLLPVLDSHNRGWWPRARQRYRRVLSSGVVCIFLFHECGLYKWNISSLEHLSYKETLRE